MSTEQVEESTPSQGNPNSGERSSRKLAMSRWRLLVLFGALIVASILYWLIVGRSRWQESRYQHENLVDLAEQTEKGDYRAGDVLTQRAIRENHAEIAAPALEKCWAKVAQGQESISVPAKAQLAGDLSLALMLSARTQEAPPFFVLATQLDNQCIPGHLAMAVSLSESGDYEHAVQQLKTVTDLDPSNDLAWYLLAHIYDQNNYCDRAIATVKKAIKLNPKNAMYWEELGDAYAYSGRTQDSVAPYQQEMKLAPDSQMARADVSRALALTAKTQDQFRSAASLVKEVLASDPVNPGGGWLLLGDLDLRFGHYTDALAAYRESLRFDDSVLDTYYKMARAQRMAGDLAGAAKTTQIYQNLYKHFTWVRTLQKQVSEKPKDPDLHFQLGQAWEFYKAWPICVSEYEAALQLRPGWAEAQRKVDQLKPLAAKMGDNVPESWVLTDLLRAQRPNLPSVGKNAATSSAGREHASASAP